MKSREMGVHALTQGLGEALPYPDNHFDLVTMGYALRHVADLNSAFEEYHRVLKPGGKVLLLEISRPETTIAAFFLKLYLKGLIPGIARLFSRSIEAKILMRYYWDTIETCVAPSTIIEALARANFFQSNRHLVLSMFSEYSGIKPYSS